MDPGITLCGDDLISVECEDARSAQALADHLRESGEWLECVAGIASCVTQFDLAAISAEEAERRLSAALRTAPGEPQSRAELVEVRICYGGDYGPDLDDVCEMLGVTHDAFIGMHTASEYSVDMLGFTPGFAFIGGFDEARDVPRRAQPRVRLAAGSIGIAGGRTGIYTLPSPGGWQIVGRTPTQLFDVDAEQPFLLRAGTRVRFVAISSEAFEAERPE